MSEIIKTYDELSESQITGATRHATRSNAATWSSCSRAERESDGYGAIVVEFVDAPGAEEFAGFCLGERVSFARANVIHLEQRAPRSWTERLHQQRR